MRQITNISRNQRMEKNRNDSGCINLKYSNTADPIANTFTRISSTLISILLRKWYRSACITCFLSYEKLMVMLQVTIQKKIHPF